MLTTFLLIFILGLSWGWLLLILSLRWLIKVKCPQCKQLRPALEVMLLHWKTRTITGQPCLKCQKPKPQIDIL